MSEGVWITKTGFRATKWDGDLEEYVDKPIKHIFHELRTNCHIDEGVTLGDIIAAVGREPKLVELVSEYSWCNVRAFCAEALKPTSSPSDLKWIEVSRFIEINGAPCEPALDATDSLHICGRDDSDTSYAIEMTPVNELAHLPVKLNPNVVVHDWRERSEDGGIKVVAECPTYFSLLEVITEIFYEISFLGSPTERDEFTSEFKQTVDEVKAGIESGEMRLVPFEPDKDVIQ